MRKVAVAKHMLLLMTLAPVPQPYLR